MTDGMRALRSGLDQWQQKLLELKSSKPFKWYYDIPIPYRSSSFTGFHWFMLPFCTTS